MRRSGPPQLYIAANVSAAEATLKNEPFDWLFIRTTFWNDFQRLDIPLSTLLCRVVFLSGRSEYFTAHLPSVLDAHLRPPYEPAELAKIWKRLSAPTFLHQPLDIFFLSINRRLVPVRYCDFRQVRKHEGKLLIETRHFEYTITGAFTTFQAGLPLTLSWLRRGWWVNDGYEP